ncbi:DUF885 domain-containing protein [Pseudoduganella namucuonensis]|uniref:Uncharacterized conserved protein, DUF885 familyt n=1 Tax=Pseudoduganella namucuonensis TaxID=1035707 RepID=A0A1I7GTZ9_9BURK|nr:DUF885 family protein [Pseudoduganella namucuonensis]SFU51942.1 Uncharacterized conserved protein, DUF885 familyt [Pseudoduganella namucuonensis]
MKKSSAAIAGACIIFAAAVPSHAAPAAAKAATRAEARFKSLYTEEWAWRLRQRMEDEEDDVHGNGIRPSLPRVDPATQQARLDYWRNVMRRLDAIAPASLSAGERINYAVYRAQIAALIDNQRFREYEKPLNADSAFWSNMAGDARKTFRTAAEYGAYVAQLNDVPRYFRDEIANMRAGLKRGFTPPRVTLAGRDGSIAAVTGEKDPQKLVFYKPFREMPASIPADEQARLREAALKAIREAVVPAHEELLEFMRAEYIPGATEALAAESLPDGKAYYQSKIAEFTTTAMSAEQIHQTGLAEMAKIRAEMLDVMRQVKFEGDLPAFLQFLRTDPRFYAKTPEELLMRAAHIAKRFDGKVGDYFGYLPRKRFAIIPVPPEQAPFYTSGRGGPGVYLVNTYNLPARALYSLPALTLHESAPGHAFQMPIALEQKGRPAFRKAYISAYGEGWALYTERLGAEMGMYETPYEVFGMLSYQAWRASRLVVDTGVHAKGWTRERAQAYLHDNTALSAHEIETEVDRYISWPGQALSYYLGEMAIVEARKRAEAALGARFDIRAFHDTVLNLGSVPLPVLRTRIDDFIAEGGKSPYPKED